MARSSLEGGRSYGEPVDLVGVCGETGATGVLLITGAVDDDGVLECAYAKETPITLVNFSEFVSDGRSCDFAGISSLVCAR